MTSRFISHTLVCALGMTLSSLVLAHGDAHEAAPRTFDAKQVEDTPFGREGDPKKVRRTVRLDMSDAMRFTPSRLVVKRGETVRLVASNKGQVLHELVLGTPEALKNHAEQMRRFPEMEHDEPHMAHVKPGKSGEIVGSSPRPGSSSSPA